MRDYLSQLGPKVLAWMLVIFILALIVSKCQETEPVDIGCHWKNLDPNRPVTDIKELDYKTMTVKYREYNPEHYREIKPVKAFTNEDSRSTGRGLKERSLTKYEMNYLKQKYPYGYVYELEGGDLQQVEIEDLLMNPDVDVYDLIDYTAD